MHIPRVCICIPHASRHMCTPNAGSPNKVRRTRSVERGWPNAHSTPNICTSSAHALAHHPRCNMCAHPTPVCRTRFAERGSTDEISRTRSAKRCQFMLDLAHAPPWRAALPGCFKIHRTRVFESIFEFSNLLEITWRGPAKQTHTHTHSHTHRHTHTHTQRARAPP